MMTTRLAAPLVLLALALTAAPALAGFVIVEDSGNRTAIGGGRIRLSSRQSRVVALDVGRGRVWLSNATTRTVWEGTVDEFCDTLQRTISEIAAAVQRQTEERNKASQDQLAKMTPAQREQVKQLLEKLAPKSAASGPPSPKVAVTVEATDEAATVAGRNTRRYRVLADGRPFQDLWLTPDPELLREVGGDRAPSTFGRVMGCLAGITGRSAEQSVEASPEYTGLFRIGWPLRITQYPHPRGRPQRGEVHTQALTVERGPVAESEFTPPADHKRAPLEEVLGAVRPR